MGAPALLSTPAVPAAAGSRRWLFGPRSDLLLGCGVGYLTLLVLLCLYGSEVRTGLPPSAIPLLTVLIGAPHYGATLLRVYERREDRRAYALFAVWITGLLAAAFVAATRSAWIGSLVVTLYLTWSPWHYTGQNYGLAVMFLRRRGIPLADPVKRLLHASFVLSFALTFVAMHQERPSAPYAPSLYEGYQMLSLGIPAAIASVAVPALALAWVATLAAAALALRRQGRVRDLAPTALLVLTQSLWFPLPVLAREWQIVQGLEPFSAAHSTYYFFYAALGHSIQYTWVASYYARSAPGHGGLPRYLAAALLAGAAIWTLPALLFAPGMLGRLPFEAGLGALVAAVVNLHHFVLDGAIWKLRDGRIARVLVRNERRAEPAPGGGVAMPWLRPLAWALGAASLAVLLLASWEQEFGLRRALARGDAARAEAGLAHLDLLGRESPTAELQLGQLLAQRGDLRGALRHYQRSLALQPTVDGFVAVADLHESHGRLAPADAALAGALALEPRHPVLAYRAGNVALKRGDAARARALLERAVSLEPDKPLYRLALDRAARAAAGANGD